MANPAANRSAALERVAVDSSLGSDAFRARSFRYTESLGQPFTGVLEASSKNASIDCGQLLGTPLTVTATLPGGGQQHRSGLVRRVVQTGFERDLAVYELEIVPWIACLELGSDCRIFQNKSVVDILKKIFDDLGFSDYDDAGLVGSYQPLDFCVQYNESHFNFVHRLMQRAGIYYFHKHEAGSHTLVLADSHTSHGPFPGYAKIPYRPAKQAALTEEHIFLWKAGEQMTTGKYTVKDYTFTDPKAKLVSTRAASHAYPHGDLERFEYPGGYATQAGGDAVATARIEQSECREREFTGEAHCLGLSAGFTFALEGQPRSDQNQSYLTEAIEFTIAADEPAESGQAARPTGYSHGSRFRAIPASVQFRPPRTAATPRIDGVQTAVVVAPAGYDPRTPYTDSVASARVQFRWDRAGSDDEKSSCWVRCSQPSAGDCWGSLFLPLAGNEVVVAFLNGDPDRPIIVGNVYNAANLPPRALPEDPYKTIIQDVAGNYIALDSEEGYESLTVRTIFKDQYTMLGDCSTVD